MIYSKQNVIDYINENDVKFIRLAFCDIFGVQKNISIMPSELPFAFKNGVPFKSNLVNGFLDKESSELFLVPDPSTLTILPWRPSHGRVVRMFCDIKKSHNEDYEGDVRGFLKKAIKVCDDMGYTCKISSECEFYLFKMSDDGEITDVPFDHGSYCDISPVDKGENVRREICLTLEQMGLTPKSSHHEMGPGQNEIVFINGDIMPSADNFLTFKSVVKSIAAKNGLYASFMPKPLKNEAGSGHNINISLYKNGVGLFSDKDDKMSGDALCFISGILNKISEMTLFFNTLTNSYDRFGSFDAPKYIAWSSKYYSSLLCISETSSGEARVRLRSADPACNPYLAFALLILAGLDGIKKKVEIIKPSNDVLPQSGKALPENLMQAIDLSKNSKFIKELIPDCILNSYFKLKENEWERYISAEDKPRFEKDTYFPFV